MLVALERRGKETLAEQGTQVVNRIMAVVVAVLALWALQVKLLQVGVVLRLQLRGLP
jgi:hypothetical protein